MAIVDWVIVVLFFTAITGAAVIRVMRQLVEFRLQRRIARLLERNAELLEREGMSPNVHTH